MIETMEFKWWYLAVAALMVGLLFVAFNWKDWAWKSVGPL